jgi:hypothetical protein
MGNYSHNSIFNSLSGYIRLVVRIRLDGASAVQHNFSGIHPFLNTLGLSLTGT